MRRTEAGRTGRRPGAPRRTARWHPVTAGVALAAGCLLLTGPVLAAAGRELSGAGPAPAAPGWLGPAAWLLMAAAAGYATSGST